MFLSLFRVISYLVIHNKAILSHKDIWVQRSFSAIQFQSHSDKCSQSTGFVTTAAVPYTSEYIDISPLSCQSLVALDGSLKTVGSSHTAEESWLLSISWVEDFCLDPELVNRTFDLPFAGFCFFEADLYARLAAARSEKQTTPVQNTKRRRETQQDRDGTNTRSWRHLQSYPSCKIHKIGMPVGMGLMSH